MAKTDKRLQQLFDLYLNKTASEEEKTELWDYVNDPVFAVAIIELLEKDYIRPHNEPGLSKVQSTELLQNIFVQEQDHQPKTIKLWPKLSRARMRFAVAASIAIAIITGGYFYYQFKIVNRNSSIAWQNDIAPGRNGATLTLADGRKILINDAVAGNIANEAGVTISKDKDGQIVYEVSSALSSGERLGLNTLTTTRGEQAKVRLPDGTLVFLNSASSLKYPVVFGKQRHVELTGEAYFEVEKAYSSLPETKQSPQRIPFIVTTATQKVEVLGTHFNINSYADEAAVKTTLLEGSVRVSSLEGAKQSLTLIPGQQAVNNGENLTVQAADLEYTMGWKDGNFVFTGQDIKEVMSQLQRWYNIEVVYEGEVGPEVFHANISRHKNISQILNSLKKTNAVHFKIEGRRVMVGK